MLRIRGNIRQRSPGVPPPAAATIRVVHVICPHRPAGKEDPSDVVWGREVGKVGEDGCWNGGKSKERDY